MQTDQRHQLSCKPHPGKSNQERDYVQPDVRVTTEFKNKLEKNGINATIRREMGRDIDGACGQLRKRYMGS